MIKYLEKPYGVDPKAHACRCQVQEFYGLGDHGQATLA